MDVTSYASAMARAPSAGTVAAVARQLPIECRTCGRRVESIDVDVDSTNDGYRLVLRCHGAREIHEIPRRAVTIQQYDVFPVAAFLRSAASYGAVSADARRERRLAR